MPAAPAQRESHDPSLRRASHLPVAASMTRGPERANVYLHARYYDAEIGTFISPDPLHPADPAVGMNRYLYAHGNPANVADRSGLVGDPCGSYGNSFVTVCSGTGGWWQDPWLLALLLNNILDAYGQFPPDQGVGTDTSTPARDTPAPAPTPAPTCPGDPGCPDTDTKTSPPEIALLFITSGVVVWILVENLIRRGRQHTPSPADRQASHKGLSQAIVRSVMQRRGRSRP